MELTTEFLEAHASLRSLGLTKYESAVYLSLLKTGPVPALQISKISKVPPTAVYPNLRSLIAKGLVQQISSDKGIFEANDPKISLSAFASSEQLKLSESAEKATALLGNVKMDPLNTSEPASLSMGLEQSHRIFLDFSEKAEKRLWILGWNFKRATHDMGILKSLNKAVKRKVDVRMMTNSLEAKNPMIIDMIASAGIKIKETSVRNFSIMVRDGKESKITLKNSSLPDRLNIHIHDEDLSAALEQYFETLWKRAKDLKKKSKR